MTWKVFLFCFPLTSYIEGRKYIVETKGKMLSVVKYLLTRLDYDAKNPLALNVKVTVYWYNLNWPVIQSAFWPFIFHLGPTWPFHNCYFDLFFFSFFQLNAEVGTRSMKVDTKIEKMKTKTSSEDYLISNYCKVSIKIEFRHLQHPLNFHSASSGIHILWWI